MNKKTKGLAALAAGAALMIGGAGTFALWFDTQALDTDVTPIATGQLYLGENPTATGQWQWAGVSNTPTDGPEAGDAFGVEDQIVPGDTISWVWTESDIDYFLSGNTIVANLYLDGVQVHDATALEPLEFSVDDETIQFEGGVVVLATGLTAGENVQNFDGSNIPSFTITFPTHGGTTGHGHQPDADLGGYGRDRQDVQVVNLTGLTVRLQQIPAGS